MIYINAFIFCGVVCLLGQMILEFTKLTPGHLNTILVVIGSILAGLGLYDILIEWAGAGATVPITNFGSLLVKGALEGYEETGITGMLQNIFSASSGGLTVTILMAFMIAVIFKPKD